MLLVFMINSHIQNNCCKHHISGKGWTRTTNTYLVMERIAVEVTNMTYNLLLLYQLSYLAIFTAYNGQTMPELSFAFLL